MAPHGLQTAQRQAPACCCSVSAKLAIPGSLEAISSVAKENPQQTEAEAASWLELSVRNERQGGIRKGMTERGMSPSYTQPKSAAMGCCGYGSGRAREPARPT